MSEAAPDGWASYKVGDFATSRRGITYNTSNLAEKDQGFPLYVNMKSFLKDGGYNRKGDKYFNGAYSENNLLLTNELVIANTDVTPTGDIIGVPALIPKEEKNNNILFSHHVSVLTLSGVVAKEYLYYLFCLGEYRLEMRKIGRGTTVLMLDMEALKKIPVKIPPLSEQQKIASILTSVDEVIEKTESQISKLQDLKKGMMQELLTKGIGHTEFKDSPVGRIPKEWEAVSVSDVVASYSYGPRFNASNYDVNGNVKTIRGTDVAAEGIIKYKQVPVALLDDGVVAKHELKDGDIVMITTADCGLTAIFQKQNIPYISSAYAIRLRPSHRVNPYYFCFYMQTDVALSRVDKYIRKGTVANLPGSDVLKIRFPLPSIDEQNKIVSVLSSIDSQLRKKELKQSKNKIIKKALMQDLLTGKVRVKTD